MFVAKSSRPCVFVASGVTQRLMAVLVNYKSMRLVEREGGTSVVLFTDAHKR